MATVTPGKFRLDKVELVSNLFGSDNKRINILGFVNEVIIYENIFSNVITGGVSLTEMVNIPSNYPMVGHETISFDIIDPDLDNKFGDSNFNSTFKVYTINNESNPTDDTNSYTVRFQSEEQFKSHMTSVSKAYGGSSISDYVNSIYSDYISTGKDIFVEPTREKYNFVIPNWKPFNAINWLAQNAIGEDKFGSNYMFFETRDGFTFSSLESYFENDIKQTYVYEKSVGNENVPIEDAHTHISSYEVEKRFNILKNIPLGMYASRLIVHDIIKREIDIRDYNYNESYGKYVHLDEGKPEFQWEMDDNIFEPQSDNSLISPVVDNYSRSPLSYQKVVSKHTGLYSSEGSNVGPKTFITNDYVESTLQNRISQIAQLNNFMISFTVPGDFERKIGDIIYFEIPTNDGVDRLYSGKYIILILKHILDPETHNMEIIAAKDSYFSPLPA